jgi:hypothetical protein
VPCLLGVVADETGPLLEDLHWTDADTLGLVEFLADHLRSTRALCLCTERSDSSNPAADLIATLAARRAGLRWSSYGFSCEATGRALTCVNPYGRGFTLPRYRGLPSYF